jgi:hypothetical protein
VRSPTRTLSATVLCFEALVVFFGGLVAMQLSDAGRGVTLGVPTVLAAACLLTAGLLRYQWGFAIGWLLQFAMIATGVLVTAMYFVGIAFMLLWFWGIRLGRRIERDRAAASRARR